MKTPDVWHWAAIACLLSWTPIAAGAERDPLNGSFYVAVGTFAFKADTELRIDGDAGQQGTVVDWERDLGLGDRNSFRVDAFWRIADRHKLRAMYFENNRSASRTLERDISIDGGSFPADALVEVRLETRIIELAYEWAFLKRESYEVSATAGIHQTQLVPSLEIRASGDGVIVNQSAKAKLDAPLPVFGVRGMWHLGRNFYLDAHAQYFYLSFDGSDGALSDLRAAITWNPRNWFGVGLGYNRFATDVDVDRDNFEGKLDWTYQGPQAFFIATF